MSNLATSERLRQFYEGLATTIPCPEPEARDDLRTMPHPELLVRYLNWADRFVAARPRRVVTWDGFLHHGSGALHMDQVHALATEVEAGSNLSPYLSEKSARDGYMRPSGKRKRRGVEWADKDYALNAYEMHHLHLDRAGTEQLLYVNFSREDAFFLMVGDHKSFDDGSLALAVAESRKGTPYELRGVGLPRPRAMTEYNRLQRAGLATFLPAGDQVVMGANLTSAGTSTMHTLYAQRIVRKMKEWDSQIDNEGFGSDWLEKSGKPYPASPNFQWAMDYCDLCLLETVAHVKIRLLEWKR